MEKNNNWKKYYENIGDKPPRKELIEAMRYVDNKDFALDLGAGKLQDSKHLLNEGFDRVVAVDSEESVRDIVHEEDGLEVVISPFEDFNFPKEKFSLVNAQYSLPFTNPNSFVDVFESIVNSLKEGGVFVGQFFGIRDGWSNNPKMTFLTKEQIEVLFNGLEVLKLEEIENDGKTAAGENKHWHIFDFIVKKQPDPYTSN
jgi:tellurite methyltransferase